MIVTESDTTGGYKMERLIKEILDEGDWLFYDEEIGDSQIADFADEFRRRLSKLHPAQLGIVLLEVQAAKEIRYPAPHPDYFNALNFCLAREGEPRQRVARLDIEAMQLIINDFKES
jgi:hypothetical protein